MMDTTRALPEDVISGAVLENKANPRRKARGPEDSRAPPPLLVHPLAPV